MQQKRQRAQDEIIHVAKEVLREGGVDAVTLASVAGKLSITKQALYHYFPSKESLVRSLITSLLDDEIESIISAIAEADLKEGTLGVMIREFYKFYIGSLNPFRIIYCQSQLYLTPELGLDEATLREEINPRTRRLFDVLEERLATTTMNGTDRGKIRHLAFSAWLAAVGLMTMLGIADATQDPLIHSDKDLVETLADVFDNAAG